MGRRVLRRVLRRGSKKGLSRRHPEGRKTPFREYDPVGVCHRSRREGVARGIATQAALWRVSRFTGGIAEIV